MESINIKCMKWRELHLLCKSKDDIFKDMLLLNGRIEKASFSMEYLKANEKKFDTGKYF